MTTLNPRIYVACLASYNNGILHGKWIDAAQGIEGIWEGINEVLATSPIPGAEEWAIHDREDFGGFDISKYEAVEEIAEIAQFFEEHGELGAELLRHFCDDLDTAKTVIEDCYYGEYDSEEGYARSITEETSEIPSHLAFYIDYKKMAHDIFTNDCFSIEVNGFTHVFGNH